MPNIEIDIAQKIATVRGYPSIVLGNDDYSITFYFDSEWSGYTSKTLVLSLLSAKTGMLQTKEILFHGDTVNLPAILNTGEISIGVYAGDLKTSTNAIITCYGVVNPANNPHPNPEPDVYTQLLAYLLSLGGAVSGKTAIVIEGAGAGDCGATTIIETEVS